MIIDKAKRQALARDAAAGGLKIRRAELGPRYMALELEDRSCGLSFRFAPDPFDPDSAAVTGPSLEGLPASRLISWAGDPRSLLRSAIGIAVINALTPWLDPDRYEGADSAAAAGIVKGDKVGMIGFFPPLVRSLEPRDDIELRIFERQCKESHPCLYPDTAEYRLLPQCDVVIVTGTAGINGTLDQVLSWCSGARDVAVTGPTVMMYPGIYAGTRATLLAGAWSPPERREELFSLVRQGACGQKIHTCLEKRVYRLRESG